MSGTKKNTYKPNKPNKPNKSNKPNKPKTKKGGEVIDSGAYGCVFYPALKCKNKKTRTNGISKLSLKRHSITEWNTYKKIVSLLRVIPNYKKYFLLDNFSICTPDKLTEKDKINLDTCDALEEYNSTNINKNLNNLMMINMPHGGRNLDIVISNNLISYNALNILIINLIENAIIPMNKLDIYHFDIKASNILYKNNNIKIIDFGTLDFKTKESPIPKRLLKTLGIQFNSPISNILFNTFILNRINYSLKEAITNKQKITVGSIYKFFKKIYNSFIYNFSEAHEQLLELILLNIYKIKNKKTINSKNTITDLICNYCSHAIFNCIDFKRQEFDHLNYFNNIFSKNIDRHGVLSCYIHYILTPHTSYSNEFKSQIIDIIFDVFFSYQYAITVIPIEEIMSKLNKITM